MAVVSKEELLNKLSEIIGESTEDTTLSLLEDIDDTLTDYETRVAGDEDWKAKYEENDAAWKKKYRDRFFEKKEVEEEEVGDDGEETKKTKYEELFED